MAMASNKLVIPKITMAECDEADVLPCPERQQARSSDPRSSPQYLCVDETKRPRANSDPVGLHICISAVPEIRVTGEDGTDSENADDEESDSFLIPPSPRRRANTCPEDMFRANRGRPPTPPPTDIHILKSPGGKRFSFNFAPKDLNGISFAHHKLSKVSEERAEQQQKEATNSQQHIKGHTGPSLGVSSAACGVNTRVSQRSSAFSSPKDKGVSTLHIDPSDTVRDGKCSCDANLSSRMATVSVKEETTNNNDKQGTSSNTEVIPCSSDSCRAKENSRDNVDSARLKAF